MSYRKHESWVDEKWDKREDYERIYPGDEPLSAKIGAIIILGASVIGAARGCNNANNDFLSAVSPLPAAYFIAQDPKDTRGLSKIISFEDVNRDGIRDLVLMYEDHEEVILGKRSHSR